MLKKTSQRRWHLKEQYNFAGGEKGSIWCSAVLCLVAQPCPTLQEQPKRRHGSIVTECWRNTRLEYQTPSGRGHPPLFPVSISRISVLQSFWLKTTVSSLIPPFLHCPHNQIQTNCITYKFFIINSAEI